MRERAGDDLITTSILKDLNQEYERLYEQYKGPKIRLSMDQSLFEMALDVDGLLENLKTV